MPANSRDLSHMIGAPVKGTMLNVSISVGLKHVCDRFFFNTHAPHLLFSGPVTQLAL